MTDFKNSVKKFSGKVKIADIQAEFDRLVNGINDMVNTINTMNELQEFDFSKGSVRLAGQYDTLTLGALKQVLNLYDGTVLGGKCVNIEGYCKVFPSLYISKDYGVVQIPESVIQPNEYATDLYFNPQTEDIGFPAGEVIDVPGTSGSEQTYTDLNNNNVYGSITSNQNSTNAYLATTSSGLTFYSPNYPNYSGTQVDLIVIWNFPKKVTLIDCGCNASVDNYAYPSTLKVETLEGVDITSSVPVGTTTRGVTVTLHTGAWKSANIKNLYIQVLESHSEVDPTTIIDTGIEDLTGYQKIAMLDWVRGEQILNTTKDYIYAQPDKIPVIKMDTATFTPSQGNGVLNNSSTSLFYLFRGRSQPTTNPKMNVYTDLSNTLTPWLFAGSTIRAYSWSYNPLWIPKGVGINGLTNNSFCWRLTYSLNTGETT